ncbi:hypothetical protein ACU6U9_07615 [Pseudomonas sp. HK3]|jgi:GH24 family phage-related lysozyme (muramidase)
MSFEISASIKQTFVSEQNYDIKINLAKFEEQFDFIKDKLNFNGKPNIEQPEPPTWPGANGMMSGIGEIMLLLAKVGIALRDQQREQTKIHHDSAVHALKESASLTRDQATAAFVTAIVSFAFSVGLSAMGIRAQKTSNTQMAQANNLNKQASALQPKADAIKLQHGPHTQADTKVLSQVNTMKESASALQAKGGMSSAYATTYSQSIMASGQVISGVGQGVNLTMEAEKKETEAVSQTHQKASDLASQDYQEMEKFRSNLVSSLKEIVNLMNEIVKTTTQV